MRRRYGTVLDEYLVGASNTTPSWTTQELDIPLAAFDQLALHAVVDHVDAAGGTLNVQVYHSADGVNFAPKTGSPEVSVASLSASATNQSWGYADTGPPTGKPLLGMVRLRIWFSGTTARGHVRIHATQRDVG